MPRMSMMVSFLYFHLLICFKDDVTSITISNDDKYIITGSNDGCIRVISLENMKVEYQIAKAQTCNEIGFLELIYL